MNQEIIGKIAVGSLITNGRFEDQLYRLVQLSHLTIGERIGTLFRMYVRLKQNFIHDPVTQAGYDMLVEQNRFDEGFLTADPISQGITRYIQAILTDFFLQQIRIDITDQTNPLKFSGT